MVLRRLARRVDKAALFPSHQYPLLTDFLVEPSRAS
jgi:hypothetical protein